MGRAAHAKGEASHTQPQSPIDSNLFIMANLYHTAMTKR